MKYNNIPGEFINELQLILSNSIPDVDRNTIDDIKLDANEALTKLLIKYKLMED